MNEMNEIVEKKNHLNRLFDFYQRLLTDRQREIFGMYFLEDYSLAEIASSLSISRNAVFDALKKVSVILDQYEEALGLSRLYDARRRLIEKLKHHCDDKGCELVEQLERLE